MSGNLENVLNKTPESSLRVASGTLQTLTIDEEAVGSNLTLDPNATVKTLNLDTGVPVIDNGDHVKIMIVFRGREMAHKEMGQQMLDKVLGLLEGEVVLEGKAQFSGRNFSVGIRKK